MPNLDRITPGYYPSLVIHAVPAGVALVTGPWQFVPRLRTRFPRLHRVTGRVYLVSVVAAALAAVYSSGSRRAVSRCRVAFVVLIVAWLYTAANAYRAIRRREVALHRIWVVLNYTLTFAAVGSDWCHVNGREDERRHGAVRAAVAGVTLLAVAVTAATGWVDWEAVGQWALPRAVLLTLWLLSGLLLAGAGYSWWRTRRPRTRHRGVRRSPPLSWWAVAAAALVIAAVAWSATTWLLEKAATATDPGAAEVEAIKTGLGIGAGTAGVFALLLAVRRQWHQEITAVDTTFDATERRVTDLYTKAADQLGSDKAPVRLAGLYALERLAQDNPTQRQTIVNVLCAYLRMPYALPGTPPDDTAEDDTALAVYRERVQEREVRLAAQRLLAIHLHPGADRARPVAIFWPDIDLDLTGATLINLSLSGCRTRTATFNRAQFTGPASFHDAQFTGPALFHRAQFAGPALFDDAQFTNVVSFNRVQFTGPASFNGAQFTNVVSFHEAQFTRSASFQAAWFAVAVPPVVAPFLSPRVDAGQQEGVEPRPPTERHR